MVHRLARGAGREGAPRNRLNRASDLVVASHHGAGRPVASLASIWPAAACPTAGSTHASNASSCLARSSPRQRNRRSMSMMLTQATQKPNPSPCFSFLAIMCVLAHAGRSACFPPSTRWLWVLSFEARSTCCFVWAVVSEQPAFGLGDGCTFSGERAVSIVPSHPARPQADSINHPHPHTNTGRQQRRRRHRRFPARSSEEKGARASVGGGGSKRGAAASQRRRRRGSLDPSASADDTDNECVAARGASDRRSSSDSSSNSKMITSYSGTILDGTLHGRGQVGDLPWT